MAFFQNSVLKKYLKAQEQDQNKIDEAYSKLKIYQNKAEQVSSFREEEYQSDFLNDVFVNVLGYKSKYQTQDNYNLVREEKNESDSKKADGAIVSEGKTIAVIELKGTDTKDLERVTKQAFGYKVNHKGCVYVIISNFEKIRFYINNQVEYLEFNLFTLNQDEFKLLWLCLSSNNLISGIPLRIRNESVVSDDYITKELYKDYSNFKTALWHNLEDNHPDIDPLILYKKSQKLLDRFLFIFFSEDKGLLPPNSISEIIKQWNAKKDDWDNDNVMLYDRFKKYFQILNTGFKGKQYEIFAYNGGLFYSDEVLDSFKIDDDILHPHVLKLTAYDFDSEVDVNILGHIFENSLSEIETITNQLEGKELDKSKTKRKKDGVFYTPKYITKYIVESTIGKLCDNKKEDLSIIDEEFAQGRKNRKKDTIKKLDANLKAYRNWLLSLTICDPACGSGAFLNQSLNFLIDEHKYIDELRAQLFGSSIVFEDVNAHILENNLYGVDINEESVDIAKLSLWLRTAKKGRKLTTLNNNIKCGNSLIDNTDVAGNKAFHWKDEFPQVFDKGGFDVVIGNPPYVDLKGLDNEIVKYLFKTFKSANNRVNLYSSFIEKSVSLMNNKGYFSFIIPSSLLTQESYKDLRYLLLDQTTIENIIRLPNESFGGGAGEVKVDTIILTFKSGIKEKAEAEIIIYKGFDRISEISNYNSDINFIINPFDWKNDENFIFRINADNKTTEIINKCQVKTKRLIECAEFCLGLTPYDKYKGHSQEQIKNRAFHLDYQKDDTYKMLLAGNDITRYNVEWGGGEWISYGDWLGASRENRFFIEKRILVKQIIDWSDKRIWSALTNEELYNTQNAFNLIPKQEEFEAEYLIALINSKLMSFYHKKQFLEEFKDRFQKILIKDAKEFPVKDILIDEQQVYIQKVQSIVLQNSTLRKLTVKFVKYCSSQFSLEKVSRKLQNWHQLDFGDFIKEINKAIKKVGGDKLDDKAQFSLMSLFEEQQEEAQTLKAEINKTDTEIDAMVFELYGLTKEEIKIVEES